MWEERLSGFQYLETLETEYEATNGLPPYNVSLWDPEPSFIQSIGIVPELRGPSSPFEYVFSYKLPSELKQSIAFKLGYPAPRAALLTPSGTAANLIALSLVKLLGKRRLWIYLPVYFQVPIAAHGIGIEVISVPSSWTTLGENNLEIHGLDPELDAVWLTHPMHGFGNRLNAKSVATLSRYMDSGGIVLADECFCPNGMELARQLGNEPGFIGTYSPHKSVCMNGVKMGIVVAASLHIETLEQRSDVWAGPLTRMTVADAEHFLSANYDNLAWGLNKKLREAECAVESICAKFECSLLGENGLYRAICVQGLSPELEKSEKFIRQIINASGTSFISLHLNYGPPDISFSFRINLARWCTKMEAALIRLLRVLRTT